MALGGGTWLFQNKVLGGTYINFKSRMRAIVDIVDRGYGALAVELDWGPQGEIFTIEASDFQEKSLQLLGYEYSSEKLKGLRDLFKNLKTCYLYRLGSGGTVAKNTIAQAKYPGIRGNDITVKVEALPDDISSFKVYTYIKVTSEDGTSSLQQVDLQTAKTFADLKENAFVKFTGTGALTANAGAALQGGTNGTAANSAQHQDFLEKVSAYYVNTIGVVSTDNSLKSLYASFIKRIRDDVGIKTQCVIFGLEGADYEGIISINPNNAVEDSGWNQASSVYWVTGASASCAVNASLLNKAYDGEFKIKSAMSQTELIQSIKKGYFTFHRVADPAGGDITGRLRVLDDINSFTSFTVDKNKDFSLNQVIRVCDQFAIDASRLFNLQFLGKVPNTNSGRVALWTYLVKLATEYQRVNAIQNFVEKDIPVPTQGDEKDTVLANLSIEPVAAMKKLYMSVEIV